MRTLVRSPFAHLTGYALVLLAACASSGGGSDAPPRPIAVSLLGYGSAPFRLVSESHTSRVDLYSSELSDASTKVLEDEVMLALTEHLDELGFAAHGRPGRAPAGIGAGGRIAKAIQVEDGADTAWWPLVEGAGVDELKGFQTAVKDFLQLYNVAQSWQSIDNTLGGEYFDRKKAGGN